MKLWLALALAGALALAAALPRTRRASPAQSGETSSKPIACELKTPCAWSVYNPLSKAITMTITNTFCVCAPGSSCVVTDDDMDTSALVHRCRRNK